MVVTIDNVKLLGQLERGQRSKFQRVDNLSPAEAGRR
jgi:hypothetical protein